MLIKSTNMTTDDKLAYIVRNVADYIWRMGEVGRLKRKVEEEENDND